MSNDTTDGHPDSRHSGLGHPSARHSDPELQLEPSLPDRVVNAIGVLYAAPDEPSYWEALEARVMAAVFDANPANWWQVLDRWASAGLVAAAAVLAVAGALSVRAHQVALGTAYDVVVASPAVSPPESLVVPEGALNQSNGPELRGVTFGDVISH